PTTIYSSWPLRASGPSTSHRSYSRSSRLPTHFHRFSFPRFPANITASVRRSAPPLAFPMTSTATPSPRWPDGKRLAFSVFADTSCHPAANARPIYDLLRDLGFRTTKSVWPLAQRRSSQIGGATCAAPAYREFVLSLRGHGFEIGLHNVTS